MDLLASRRKVAGEKADAVKAAQLQEFAEKQAAAKAKAADLRASLLEETLVPVALPAAWTPPEVVSAPAALRAAQGVEAPDSTLAAQAIFPEAVDSRLPTTLLAADQPKPRRNAFDANGENDKFMDLLASRRKVAGEKADAVKAAQLQEFAEKQAAAKAKAADLRASLLEETLVP